MARALTALTDDQDALMKTTFKTGQIIELHTPAHPYRHMGFTDHKYIVPAKTERLRITRVSRRGDDHRLTLRRDDNTGFGLLVSTWLAWTAGRTIRSVE